MLDEGATLKVVRRELVLLRSHRGISQTRVRDAAPVIQGLPSVTAEMTRSHLVDPAAAAYSVIECAVRHRIRGQERRLVLESTLGLAPNAPSDLAGRRALAQRKTGFYSPKSYANLEEEAFVELASFLLRLRESPCPDRSERTRLLLDQLDLSGMDSTVEVSIPLQPIVAIILDRLIHVLSVEDAQDERTGGLSEDALEDLTPVLPNAGWIVNPRGVRPASNIGMLITTAYAIAHHYRWSTEFDSLPMLPDEVVESLFHGIEPLPHEPDERVQLFNAIERLAEIISRAETSSLWIRYRFGQIP